MAAFFGVRLPAELDARLERLASETGRTKSFYAKRAIKEWLDDREDYLKAVAVLERVRKGEEKTYPAEQVWKELGLEPRNKQQRTKTTKKARSKVAS